MKNLIFRFSIILAALLITFSLNAQKKDKQPKAPKAPKTEKVVLFNGKNLSNWTFMLRDKSVDPSQVFTIKDGVINISGSPFGYMRTNGSYSDYTLHVEYRWPVEASNSGIFIHAQLPDTIWPKCFEIQLKAGSAGDFVLMNGSDMQERGDKNVRVIPKKAESTEKPAVEWNTIEIICIANSVEVWVNGTLQNKGTGLSLTSGSICLQSEGKDIQFRNVYLLKPKK